MPWAGFSLARLVVEWIGLRHNGRAETLPDDRCAYSAWCGLLHPCGRVSVDHVRGPRLADRHLECCDGHHPLASLVLRNYACLEAPVMIDEPPWPFLMTPRQHLQWTRILHRKGKPEKAQRHEQLA
jgi:hypothetical protein